MTEPEIARIADAAATRAVNKLLLHLGINPDDPTELSDARDDLAYLRRLRTSADVLRKAGLSQLGKIFAIAIVGALAAAIVKWSGWMPSLPWGGE